MTAEELETAVLNAPASVRVKIMDRLNQMHQYDSELQEQLATLDHSHTYEAIMAKVNRTLDSKVEES